MEDNHGIQAQQEIAALKDTIAALQNSTSWRITRPLRTAIRMFRGEKTNVAPIVITKPVESVATDTTIPLSQPVPVVETLSYSNLKDIAETYGADVVHFMASTGIGTDACLDKDCLPVPVHFYQPIPNLRDLEERRAWDRVSPLYGVKWDEEYFLGNLRSLTAYSDECNWPNEPTGNPMDFHLNNLCFSYGCATSLHGMIRKYKPRRIIEVGSGNSSRVIAGAINRNLAENADYQVEYSIVDPYSTLDASLFPANTTLIKQPVERLEVSFFSGLEENDILFIDSSHVCKMGSDVNFEILEVLPNLGKGVIVHFHDVGLPYEYSKLYAYTPTFRMFWTESYLLQAFLSGNEKFEVFLPMAYMMINHAALFRELFPNGNNAALWGSESFWIRRV